MTKPLFILVLITILSSTSASRCLKSYEIKYYEQTLDHFSFNDDLPKFQQRYLINTDHWVGPTRVGPIFLYCGNEGDIEWFAVNSGFVWELAPRFGALVVFPEHRYYGESMPYGGRDEAYKNASTLAHLTAEQALADYAVLITDLKRNLSAEASPVILFGGSYGGMLAAWMRLKYPHIAIGALASSAPILQFEDIVPLGTFYDIRESTNCFDTIKKSWDIMTSVGQKANGLDHLAKTFHLCGKLKSSDDLSNWLDSAYSFLAMVDYPYPSDFLMPLPAYPIKELCNRIDESPDGTTILDRIFKGVSVYYNYTGTVDCFDLDDDPHGMSGWDYQACTEMVMPMSSNRNSSMFPEWDYNSTSYAEDCWDEFRVIPRPAWITTQFGGRNIKSVLQSFGSNIIFSNGLLDPWSGGSVLENISDSIVALVTEKGAHHLDLRAATADDPDWLLEQRATEVKLIEGWIADYYKKKKAVFDIFNDDLPKFQQRYLINTDHWVGPTRVGPIFLYCGNEGDIEWFAVNSGFVWELAPRFGALVVFPEHRYYGDSMPFGSLEEAFKNASTLAYLTAEQALADYAVLTTDLKRNLSAEASPVILFGGSYGGMLAAWMRLKYPHIAIGALASSAPILQFEGLVPLETYYDIISNDFRRESTSCFDTIKNSWDVITSVGQKANGLDNLADAFHLCRKLKSIDEFSYWLESMYTYLAMANYPYPSDFDMPLPAYPIKEVCKAIDDAPDETSILDRILKGATVYYNYTGKSECFELDDDPYGTMGWNWQACTEMVMPMSSNRNSSMFPEWDCNFTSYAEECWDEFRVIPKPTWITTQFGGHVCPANVWKQHHLLKWSLRSMERWRSRVLEYTDLGIAAFCSVLENISDSIVALVTEKGAHHLDLRGATADDPDWLVEQRASEIKIIDGWIDDYYKKMKAVAQLARDHLVEDDVGGLAS
ncbi:lysosomal Pro-X carboxypeptidase [Tanacetum coccineum]